MLFSLFLVGFIGALTPGPDILYVLKNTLSNGIKTGFLSLFGIFCGWLVYLSAIYFGFSNLISGIFIQGVLSLIGGFYLFYLAYCLITSKKSSPLNSTNQAQKISTQSIILKGFLLNLSNPKAILFFAVILTPFMEAHLEISLLVLLFGLLFAFSLVITIGAFFRNFLKPSLFFYIDKICGITFALFALFLFITAYENYMQFYNLS